MSVGVCDFIREDFSRLRLAVWWERRRAKRVPPWVRWTCSPRQANRPSLRLSSRGRSSNTWWIRKSFQIRFLRCFHQSRLDPFRRIRRAKNHLNVHADGYINFIVGAINLSILDFSQWSTSFMAAEEKLYPLTFIANRMPMIRASFEMEMFIVRLMNDFAVSG